MMTGLELYNNTDNAISLAGYYLSDSGDDLTQWTFPDTLIAAHDYLVVWADNDENQDGLHADFKLSTSGEAIYLVAPDTTIINEVTFSEQTTDLSTGRYPDATGAFVLMNPTFAAPNQGVSTGIEDEANQSHIPVQFTLLQNYPNPFNPSTTIGFNLPSASRASLKIYNSAGQLITTLVDQQLAQGNYEFQWRAENLASGIYYYSVVLDGQIAQTRKMLLMK